MNRSLRLFPLLLTLLFLGCAEAQVPAEVQIEGALSAAPDHLVDGATVLGYDGAGGVITLREGSNELVCLADRPSDERFEAACYHASLAPFMDRGRALRMEGASRDEVQSTREAEIKSGALAFPDGPATLYIRYGGLDELGESPQYDALKLRYVIYTPYATPETTGLSTEATPNAPWLMNPGKPWAHIMIVPQ